MTAKKSISELHDKYYGKRSKSKIVAKVKEKVAKAYGLAVKDLEDKTPSVVNKSPSPKEGIILHAGASRNELMMAAKERGVKNFRVLSKQELSDILKNIGDQKAVDAIVAGAVTRWKSGWGKVGKRNQKEVTK
jgi:hypothetical protein